MMNEVFFFACRVLVAGRNRSNLLSLDKGGERREEVNIFEEVLSSLGPVIDISLGEKYSLVLTKRQEIWRVGGEQRDILKIQLSSKPNFKIQSLVASSYLALFTTEDGTIYSFDRKQEKVKMMDLKSFGELTKKPVKMVAARNNVLLHFQ